MNTKSIKLYDRLTKNMKYLSLDKTINVYVCGPTVYDHPHLGHGRSLIVFDILHRILSHQTPVVFVQNITDIADQILQRAEEEGKSEEDISEIYTESYNNICIILNIKPFTHQPKPTQFIKEITDYIQVLLEKNKAEIRDDGIYMKIDDSYGKLNPGCERKSFALWMFKDSYSFDSPWGKGRPGWHIECSVMSRHYFGDRFHIHGGGSDLLFPHHENEIAQSLAHSNCIPADIWMHNNMINVNGEKMSKSLRNFKYLHSILKNSLDVDHFRILCLSYSYDSLIEISPSILDKALVTLKNIRSRLFINNAKELESPSKILINYLNDNLDTVNALRHINRLLQESNYDQCLTDLRFLGFIMQPVTKITPKEINSLVEKRNEAKKAKNFKLADKIREQLANNFVNLIDERLDTTWYYI